jgi:hypothetical protein
MKNKYSEHYCPRSARFSNKNNSEILDPKNLKIQAFTLKKLSS